MLHNHTIGKGICGQLLDSLPFCYLLSLDTCNMIHSKQWFGLQNISNQLNVWNWSITKSYTHIFIFFYFLLSLYCDLCSKILMIRVFELLKLSGTSAIYAECSIYIYIYIYIYKLDQFLKMHVYFLQKVVLRNNSHDDN